MILSAKMLERSDIVKKYTCEMCGYEYDPEAGDPEHGIPENTDFEDLPEDWVCPICGVGKEEFVLAEAEESDIHDYSR